MIICVVGPTGVGKTALSVSLAKKYDAIIINADAMQVYKDLNIGTAKIKEEEKKGVPHYLFDIVDVSANYTVFDYQRDARKIINENRNKNIILVGGTGLYLKAALYNYEFEERNSTSNYDNLSNEELYELLKEKNDLNEIHINNRKRMISRLNSNSHHNLKNELLYDNVFIIGLTTDRENLYKRIDKRVDEMMDEGLLEEVRNVYQKYGKTKALNTGIGYKELIDYLDGNTALEDAISLIKQRSRKYAKRQYTWFNHQLPTVWFNTDYENFDNTVLEVINYIDSQK